MSTRNHVHHITSSRLEKPKKETEISLTGIQGNQTPSTNSYIRRTSISERKKLFEPPNQNIHPVKGIDSKQIPKNVKVPSLKPSNQNIHPVNTCSIKRCHPPANTSGQPFRPQDNDAPSPIKPKTATGISERKKLFEPPNQNIHPVKGIDSKQIPKNVKVPSQKMRTQLNKPSSIRGSETKSVHERTQLFEPKKETRKGTTVSKIPSQDSKTDCFRMKLPATKVHTNAKPFESSFGRKRMIDIQEHTVSNLKNRFECSPEPTVPVKQFKTVSPRHKPIAVAKKLNLNVECPLCYSTVDRLANFKNCDNSTNHPSCVSCLANSLIYFINDGRADETVCSYCKVKVGYREVVDILNQAGKQTELKLFRKRKSNSTLLKSVISCSNAICDTKQHPGGELVMRCRSCDYITCVIHEKPFYGKSSSFCCVDGKNEQLKEAEHQRQEQKNEQWKKENTKPCPQCQSPIEKNEGCMHMTCSYCKHEFFWCCMRAYRVESEARDHRQRCSTLDYWE